MSQTKGRVTIPTNLDVVPETIELMKRWGADAIRDCDGTEFPEELTKTGAKIYATYYTTRKDNEWAKANPDEVQQCYVMTAFYTAVDKELSIPLMKGISDELMMVNTRDDIKRWWEVIDRSTGEIVPTTNWNYQKDTGCVVICDAVPFHEYTVSFLAYIIWDPVHMYNAVTNEWKDFEHQITFDVRQPKTHKYSLERLRKYCEEHPYVNVIRYTTFFHQFTLMFDELKREKYVDWYGYSASVSPYILEQFEKEVGYPFRPEYIIDQGYYNNQYRVPSKEFKDFQAFQRREVAKLAKEMVDITHECGKEAMMFLGDHWIGTEPYGPYFESIGLDAVVGSVGDGVTMRMISDIKGVKYTEGRLLPYFFPDVFCEGGDPIGEAHNNWLKARRAILRSPLDRIGYGGYLKLALEWPGFIDTIKHVVDEFREIHQTIQGTQAYVSPFKVAILNCWGACRKWMNNQVHHSIWYREIYSYVGIIECLSGMPIDIEFINFEDVKKGALDQYKVIINAGAQYTSWSGAENWIDEEVVTRIRKWVDQGGGFIGVGDPTAYQYQGQFFQLSDVLGVDKEVGFTLSHDKYNQVNSNHFLLEDIDEEIDFGEGMDGIYAHGENYQILSQHHGYAQLVTNIYGKGRSVYFAGLPYSPQNCRLLLRAIYWAAGKESEMKKFYVSNVNTEVAAFEKVGKIAVINNTTDSLSTDLYIHGEKVETLDLEPMELRWVEI